MSIFKILEKTPAIFKVKSFETVLIDGISLLEKNVILEIKNYVKSQQNNDGGFKDKAGKSDIYYSLFGYLICKALKMNDSIKLIKSYISQKANFENLNKVDFFCRAILHKELIGNDEEFKFIKRLVQKTVFDSTDSDDDYSNFLALMVFYYMRDLRSLRKLMKQNIDTKIVSLKPSTVLASHIILSNVKGSNTKFLEDELYSRFEKGGVKALRVAPLPDLLSTATTLFAFNFVDKDLKQFKVDTFEFVTELYEDGGFVATAIDKHPDIEYTFYGLLALGSLNN